MSRNPFSEQKPKSLFPSIILRTQSINDQLNSPDLKKTYLIDIGKLRRSAASAVRAMFIATNVSVSFVFPEEKEFKGAIRIQVYKSDYAVFMFLAYMVIVVIALMVFIMFLLVIFSRCASTFYVIFYFF